MSEPEPNSESKEQLHSGALEESPEEERSPLGRLIKSIGPGIIAGASDDDPSGIGTYSAAGAAFGYSMLWTALIALPLMACVQYISAKIAMVTGSGLTTVLRDHYPRPLVVSAVALLIIANTINAGTDMGAIAATINMFFPGIPVALAVIPVSLAILSLQVFGSYKLVSLIFKALTLVLLSYVASIWFVQVDWWTALKGTFLPAFAFDLPSATMLVALLGTTISPYCFFFQASEEVEEEIDMGRVDISQRLGASDKELKAALLDIDLGMFFCVGVMYFIMVTTAATLHAHGITDIKTAADAALALRPLAGDAASLLFSLGIIGTGFLAVPVLTTSSAYAISELTGHEASLSETFAQDRCFYGVIALSTLVGVAINFIGINPITALVWTAVVNGCLAPPLLLLIMLTANNRAIMGERVNGPLANFLGWTTTILMFVASILLLVLYLLPHA